MARVFSPVLFLCVFISLFLSSSAQTCRSYSFSSNRQFSSCNDLPVLDSFIHWTYDESSQTLQIAYRHTKVSSSSWVAWAINPSSTGMIGSQALVAYQLSNGTAFAYTSPVTSYSTSLAPGSLSFTVSNLSATYVNEEMTIFATLQLPNNSTTLNQLWQVGPLEGDTPSTHLTSGDNVKSKGTLNLLSGGATTTENTTTTENNTTGNPSSSAQACSSYSFSSNTQFSSCTSLPVLNSFLHWTYDESSGTLRIAYRHTGVSSSNWVAWAINPSSTGMIGAQSLVAYQHSNGTVLAYTSPVTSYSTRLEQGSLSFEVSDLSATYGNEEMIIFATLQLPNNSPTVNHLWQVGPLSQNTPSIHSTSGDNVNSRATLNLLSGEATTTGSSIRRRRNVHGVLNAVSWGTLMPLGAIIARYLKVFKSADPAWFYLHVACQTSAYIVGVAGWATGIKLGSDSSGIVHRAHRNIGIVLFCLGTLQVFALLLRPKKDHKYRFYWNIYHHSIGYSVIILSVVNIFKGFDILDLDNENWKRAYIGIIAFLGFNALLLEAITWKIVLKRRSRNSEKSHHGANGVNGYGARSQQV